MFPWSRAKSRLYWSKRHFYKYPKNLINNKFDLQSKASRFSGTPLIPQKSHKQQILFKVLGKNEKRNGFRLNIHSYSLKNMKKIFILLVRFYQKNISPYKPRCCRFTPSCSAYAIEAFEVHGAFKGLFLALYRVLRCNPFNKNYGYDPVPEKKIKR